MFYIWDYATSKKTNFFLCGIENYEGWLDVPWTNGVKITTILPVVLQYRAENMLLPEDYPSTPDHTQFLVSSKIVNILRKYDIIGIDYYDSEIVRPNGEIIKDYYTLNTFNFI